MALLELKSEGHRETVIIDGKEYALAPFEGFSISDQHRLRNDGLRISKISDKENLSGTEIEEIEATTESWFTQIAGDIPSEVRDKLLPGLKQEVVRAYFLALAAETEKQAAIPATSKSGVKKGFRRSAGSTKGLRSKTG